MSVPPFARRAVKLVLFGIPVSIERSAWMTVLLGYAATETGGSCCCFRRSRARARVAE